MHIDLSGMTWSWRGFRFPLEAFLETPSRLSMALLMSRWRNPRLQELQDHTHGQPCFAFTPRQSQHLGDVLGGGSGQGGFMVKCEKVQRKQAEMVETRDGPATTNVWD